MQYVALLRGINVGGHNIMKMADLRASFEKMGFENVRTYIQSGNVVFVSSGSVSAVQSKIAKGLKKDFSYTSPVLVLSEAHIKKVVKDAPKKYGSEPKKYRYDVLYLLSPLTPKKALAEIPVRDGVDAVAAGTHALYFTRAISEVTKSYLPKVVQLPIYKHMTIRNWNTTMKLLEILDS